MEKNGGTCRKCRAPLPAGAKYCPACGASQTVTQRTKSRGNGQGSVYQRPNKTWIAVVIDYYYTDASGKTRKKTKSKAGFKTKREAVEYLPTLRADQRKERKELTLAQIYAAWLPTHRAGKSTMDCYKAAWKYFAPVANYRIRDIDIDDLQDCMDDCPHGKRTKENMKALCGLLYKYAIPRHQVELNLGPYLIVDAQGGDKHPGIPLDALAKLRAASGSVPYADYVVAQCYLGFRPSEFLALDVADYDREHKAFRGGAKTAAGIDRAVTVSPKCESIVNLLTAGRTEGQVFRDLAGNPMNIKNYRQHFYEVLAACGIENPMVGEGDLARHLYTPHSCRHTFATLMKNVKAADKDKLALIGHTSTAMLRHYQDTDYESLRQITDAL